MPACPVFDCNEGTPYIRGLARGVVWCSAPTEPIIAGSYEATAVPTPKVDCTNPDAPAPAPPAPPVVPPAPAPGAPVPKPPTPPPGVPCTTPAFTPRKIPPARVRNISMLAMGRL